ncbi:unnamed protein product, partial [Sphacelaria rigidula]
QNPTPPSSPSCTIRTTIDTLASPVQESALHTAIHPNRDGHAHSGSGGGNNGDDPSTRFSEDPCTKKRKKYDCPPHDRNDRGQGGSGSDGFPVAGHKNRTSTKKKPRQDRPPLQQESDGDHELGADYFWTPPRHRWPIDDRGGDDNDNIVPSTNDVSCGGRNRSTGTSRGLAVAVGRKNSQ